MKGTKTEHEWERARTAEQKEARIREVLAAARSLLLKNGFEAVSFSDISSRLSFGRANLYKYFQSKEEIFLKLLAEEIRSFGESLMRMPPPGPEDDSTEAFVQQWTSGIVNQKAMLTLLSIAGTILEKNCSDTILLESKFAMVRASTESFIPFIRRFFSSPGEAEAMELLNYLVIVATGLYPLTRLNPRQRELLLQEGLNSMVHDFEEVYAQMIRSALVRENIH
ncbi:MAG: TetR family transcriptional regulator [Leptospirales bacterium]|nr:TetR family transcriptional regulator [Leptospirales bacterium]